MLLPPSRPNTYKHTNSHTQHHLTHSIFFILLLADGAKSSLKSCMCFAKEWNESRESTPSEWVSEWDDGEKERERLQVAPLLSFIIFILNLTPSFRLRHHHRACLFNFDGTFSSYKIRGERTKSNHWSSVGGFPFTARITTIILTFVCVCVWMPAGTFCVFLLKIKGGLSRSAIQPSQASLI